MDNPNDSAESSIIAKFEKNKKEEVRLSVETFHGRKIINIRVFYKDDGGEWKPGKQGLAVAIERYKELAGAVLEVGEYLKSIGAL